MAARAERPGDVREALRAGAAALGVDLEDRALDRLERFLDELERWNARSNLVGDHDRRTLAERHLVDSLAAVPALRGLGTGLRIADVGSGAGLPGVPLAIVLQPREMVLVEPRRKRASFLRAVRRALPDVPLTVLEERVEDLVGAAGTEAAFDAVTSRAALSDAELGSAATSLLRAGGLLVAYRGATGGDVAGRSEAQPSPGPPLTPPEIERYQLASPGRSFALVLRRRCPVSRETSDP